MTEFSSIDSSFQDIRITGLDENNTRVTGAGPTAFALKITGNPPAQWIELFNTAWQSHFYLLKGRVSADRHYLSVTCSDDALQGNINELKIVVSATNAEYKRRLARAREDMIEAEEAEKKRKADLLALKGTLKFD